MWVLNVHGRMREALMSYHKQVLCKSVGVDSTVEEICQVPTCLRTIWASLEAKPPKLFRMP
jgi:hypothetical protein